MSSKKITFYKKLDFYHLNTVFKKNTHKLKRELTRAELEEVYRIFVKGDFYQFCKAFLPNITNQPFKDHWSVQYICEYIEANIKGEIDQLAISLPRGWGKSTIVSVLAPVWALLLDRTERIGCFSKSMQGEPALWHADSVKLLCDPTIQILFDKVSSSVEINTQSFLKLKERGYRKVGTTHGTAIGSDLTYAIVDDPVDQEHYRSNAKQTTYQNWYEKGLLPAIRTMSYTKDDEFINTQLTTAQQYQEIALQNLEKEYFTTNETIERKARVLFTMQRLSLLDPISLFLRIKERIEQQNVGVRIEHISIPAIQEDAKEYHFIKSNITHKVEAGAFLEAGTLTRESILVKMASYSDNADAQAQMNQNPTQSAASYIKREYFSFYNENALEMSFVKCFITTDFAFTDKSRADNTVFAMWGVTNNGNLYLIVMEVFQKEISFGKDNLRRFINKWRGGVNNISNKLTVVAIEDGTHMKQMIYDMQKEYPHTVQILKRQGNNKFTRWQDVASWVLNTTVNFGSGEITRGGGRVFLPDANVIVQGRINFYDNYILPFLNECENFNGDGKRKDDRVDVFIDACYIAMNTKKSSGLANAYASL